MKLKGDVLNRNILVEMHILVDLVPMNAVILIMWHQDVMVIDLLYKVISLHLARCSCITYTCGSITSWCVIYR